MDTRIILCLFLIAFSALTTSFPTDETVKIVKNQFPFVVSLSRQGKHYCAGSIIDPEWILTAATCAIVANFDVTAGEHNLYLRDGSEQKTRAILVVRHPQFDSYTFEDNICLVKVSPPFRFNNYVMPITVPSTHLVAHGNAAVAGWGTDDNLVPLSPVLRNATLPIVSSFVCAADYGSYFRPSKMICAGDVLGKDVCQSDSGGPLLCEQNQKGSILCGVESFGNGCVLPSMAGIYTKVAYYSEWVEFTMRKYIGHQGEPSEPKPIYVFIPVGQSSGKSRSDGAHRSSPPKDPYVPKTSFFESTAFYIILIVIIIIILIIFCCFVRGGGGGGGDCGDCDSD